MDVTMKQRKIWKTRKKRGIGFLCVVLVLLMAVLTFFPTEVRAAITGTLAPGDQVFVSREISSAYKYKFDSSDYGKDNLPPEFGQVYYDIEDEDKDLEPYTAVHGTNVNYYFTDMFEGTTIGERAVYCFEPDNPYIDVGSDRDEYDVNSAPSTDAFKALTQEQKDMLAYVLAEGVTEYTGGDHRQVATQLAVWIVGAGHYKDEWLDRLLPPTGDNPGIAPNVVIRDEARRLIGVAYDRVLGKPSFVEESVNKEMLWNGTTYSAKLTDTKSQLTAASEWGMTILSALAGKGLTGTIDDTEHSLTITGDPTTVGVVVSLILEDAKRADIVFLESPIIQPDPSGHTLYKIRQQMISINTPEAAVTGVFSLWRGAPAIATTATAEDGTKLVSPAESVTVTDTVTYTNLTVGEQYTLEGVLMDKETRLALEENGVPVTATKTFTPTQANGTTTLSFTFNASALGGKSLVVFEKLFLGNTEIAAHEEIGDEGQTVEVTEKVPTIATTATAEDGTKLVYPFESVTVVDTVTYTNLKVGAQYKLEGVLMDKDTGLALEENGVPVTATKTFTPTQANGTTTLSFTFNASVLGGKSLVVFEKLFLGNTEIAAHEEIGDEGQTVEVTLTRPVIATTAKAADGSKTVRPEDDVTIVDTVYYENLRPGVEYILKGVLMDKGTGAPLLIGGAQVIAEGTFTPTQPNGTVDMEFTFNASELADKSLVVFEKLFFGNTEIAAHEEIGDEGQTVTVTVSPSGRPTIRTSAKDKESGTKEVSPKGNVTIVDTVTYTNLTVGTEYTISGTLQDKSTGAPLLIGGAKVTATKKFTPTQANGTIDLEFTFNASALAGKTLVVFEKLLQNEIEVAAHEDINDVAQTVKVTEKPAIRTNAKDRESGTKEVSPKENVTIVDTVTYTNLTVGTEYTISGTLYDKSTGAPLLIGGAKVTATKKFTPTQANGTVDLEFTFNASALDGKTLVVFEKLLQNNKEVAVHEDINDAAQTVTVKAKPAIRTSAKDKESGTKVVSAKANVTIVDTITYSNLTVGTEYTISGTLQDKSTGAPLLIGGAKVTATKKFTPTQANGTVDLEFTFNASALAGKTLVVFEKLLQNNKEVAVHEDINDAAQTVTVKQTGGGGTTIGGGSNNSNNSNQTGGKGSNNDVTIPNPKTGELVSTYALWIALALLGLSGMMLLFKRRKFKAK